MILKVINWSLIGICLVLNVFLLFVCGELVEMIRSLSHNQELLFKIVSVLSEAHR